MMNAERLKRLCFPFIIHRSSFIIFFRLALPRPQARQFLAQARSLGLGFLPGGFSLSSGGLGFGMGSQALPGLGIVQAQPVLFDDQVQTQGCAG